MKDKYEQKTVPFYSYPDGPFHNVRFGMTDPLGSYTGVPVSPEDVPVQDADDL